MSNRHPFLLKQISIEYLIIVTVYIWKEIKINV